MAGIISNGVLKTADGGDSFPLRPEPPGGNGLVRALTLVPATALVVGVMVGTGIYLKTAVMTQALGRPALVMAAWGTAGLLSLCGALAYAELGAMMPRAGGEFVFLRAAFGDGVAFLYGWMRYIVGAGAIAAFGVAFASFLGGLVPLRRPWVEATVIVFGRTFHPAFGDRQMVAVAVIVAAAAVNLAGVATGGGFQTVVTAAKVAGLAAIVLGIFFLSPGGSWAHFALPAAGGAGAGFSAFGAATMGAFWAYSGWNYVAMAAGEVAEPERNLPRSIIAGTVLVVIAYAAVNAAYFYALPVSEIVSSSSTRFPDAPPVATKAAGAFLGGRAAAATGALFLVSVVGGLNGIVLAVTRLPYAMARAGLFFPAFGRVSPRTRVPVLSIVIAAAWASVLACSGTFDELTNMAISGYALFYALTAASVFVLRRKIPDAPRPYRVWGYPVVPALFAAGMLVLLVNALWANGLEAAAALALISLGIPVYAFFRRRPRAGRTAE